MKRSNATNASGHEATAGTGQTPDAEALRVLLVEDSADDAELVLRELRRGGYAPHWQRVDDEAGLRSLLAEDSWDVVLADHTLPGFSGLDALATAQAHDPDLPVIIVSGMAGEELAVDAMRNGAADFVRKDGLYRLAPAVRRDLRDAAHRRGRRHAEKNFRNIVEHSLQGILVHDQGKPVFANQAAAELMGCESPEALLSLDSVEELLAPEETERVRELMRRRERGEAAPSEYDMRVQRRDGSTICLHVLISTVVWNGRTCTQVAAVDVTEARRQERELHDSRELLQSVLDSIPERIQVLDAAGQTVLVNQARAAAGGHTPEAYIAQADPYPNAAPEEQERLHALDRAVLNTGEPRTTEKWMTLRDGHTEYHRAHRIPLRDPDGRITGLVCVAHDLTERKQAEEEVIASRQLLQNVLDTLPERILVLDGEGHKKLVNRARAAAVHDWTPADFMAHPDTYPNLDAEEQARLAALDRQVLESGAPASIERWVTLNDGRSEFHRSERLPLRGPDGRVTGVVCVAHDLTERKRDEEALFQSNQRLQAVLDAVPSRIVVYGSGDVPMLANEAYAASAGMTPAEMLAGKDPFPSLKPASHQTARELNRRVLESGEGDLRERWIEKRDGRQEYLRIRRIPLRDMAGAVTSVMLFIDDLTEQKQAEEALYHSREMLQAVLDAVPSRIVVHGLQNEKLVTNKAYAEGAGMSVEELLALEDPFPTLAPEMHEDARRYFRMVVESGESAVRERWVPKRDGREEYLRTRHVPLRDMAGTVTAVMVCIDDLTDVKLAEAESSRVYGLLEDALQSSDAGLALYDAEERLVIWNERMYDFFPRARGLLREGMTFEDVQYLCAPSTRDAQGDLEAYVRMRVAEFRSNHDVHRESALEDGRWLLARDERTSGGGIWSVRVDITEQRKAADALRHERWLMQTALDAMPLTAYMVDDALRFQVVNARMARYQRCEAEALIGRTHAELPNMPEASRAWLHDQCTEALRTMTPAEHTDVTLGDRNATPMDFHVWIIPMRPESSSGPLVLVVGEEITQRKLLERQLSTSQRMEALGRLAGGIAHDFNNMLAVIMSHAGFIQEDAGENTELAQDAQTIQTAAERSAALTRQLLAFGRRQVQKLEPVNMNAEVRQIEKILHRVLGEDIELRLNLARELDLIEADPAQFEQVVMNLVVNARDAMPRGGTLWLTTDNVELDSHYAAQHLDVAPGRYVMLAVADTGEGMSEAVKARIFEPFFTTREQGGGTGLGLATIYGIVQQSAGSIWVYSEVGHGTTFKVYLPRMETGRAEAQREEAAQAVALPAGCSVLIVEDESMVRSAASRILSQEGCEVLEASSGPAALELARQRGTPVDLVLSDVVMPGMSGPELLQTLGQVWPDVRVLYMSGYTDDAMTQHGMLSDGHTVLQKPFSREALLHRIAAVLE